VVTAIVVIVVIVALAWFGQRSMLYFPSSDVPAPVDVGLASAESVAFETEDGLRLEGWFVPASAQASGYTAIVFNGNAGHRGYRADLAQRFAERGLATLLFDYRGYGGNPGLPSERGLARDARAAFAYVRQRGDVDPTRIIYFGESLGAAVALGLAVEDAPAALVLRSPFQSIAAMARVHMPIWPRFLIRDRYPSDDRIASIRSPLLVIAGDADRIVPVDQSVALYAAAPEPKRLVVLEGADHNDEVLTVGAPIADAVVAFLREGA
jgi:fermentation-respiration switch protein FrsA (DUF1100 family)